MSENNYQEVRKKLEQELEELKKETIYGAMMEKMKKEKEALTTNLQDYKNIYDC